MRSGSFLRAVIVSLGLVMAGCGTTPVAQDLTQRQANEIVALLANRGISAVARKETGGKGLFAVQVPDDSYGPAVTMLQERGLPSETRLTAGDLLTPQGIIPSSREMEAMRLDYAIAAQIEEMLQSHASIAQARCVVRLNFLHEGQEPSASVVLEERANAQSLDQATVAEVVLRALPGMKRENISIVFSKGDQATTRAELGTGVAQMQMVKFLWFWQVPASEYSGLALLFSAALLLVAGAAASVGYWTCLFQRTREAVDSSFPEMFPKSIRFDRAKKDLPE